MCLCLGNIIEQDNLAIGIVGSRRASYGLLEKFALSCLRGNCYCFRMARGVDTYAHRGALKPRAYDCGNGERFNHIILRERGLAKQIASSGAVISNFRWTLTAAQNFPRRNRLISGLSLGVLITEAARTAGVNYRGFCWSKAEKFCFTW